ncbi:MAG: hypothetical protein AAGB93_18805 [Planctomycetota bacterium]
MVSFLRTLLVVLLALPAIALPPGVTLEWCLCWNADCCHGDLGAADPSQDADACCEHLGGGACCGGAPSAQGDGPGEEPTEQDSACGTSCPSCHSLEAGEFEPGLQSATASLAIPALAAVARRADPPVVTLSRVGRYVAGRAPPGAVRPAGLLPGTLPLLR